MTDPVPVHFRETDIEAIAGAEGRVAVIIPPQGQLDTAARRVNKLMRGALKRLVESPAWEKVKPGQVTTLAWPAGMGAEAVDVVCLPRNAKAEEARKAGVKLGKAKGEAALLVLAGSLRHPAELVLGAVLRAYSFTSHKTEKPGVAGDLTVMVKEPEELEQQAAPMLAVAEGVFLTRDLVSEPANHLTTSEFAARIKSMEKLGLKVKVLEEDELQNLGMGALLSVGHGSASPSKVAIMEWQGGKKGDAPLALVGKGVVFDTGGISIKPSGGMEDMKGDMGGAAAVIGLMHTLAARKAKVNAIGIIGLVENMPDGAAQRPGDIVRSMSGQTIEIINTDAEGRLVLCDALWYCRERFEPVAMVNLATLTGAIIVALGNHHAGLFSNDDELSAALTTAGEATEERVWRMPLGPDYDKMIDSKFADIKNTGGRHAGAITAAQFLKRFVKDTPWAHLDIAGTAMGSPATDINQSWGSGFGVRLLDRYVRDRFES